MMKQYEVVITPGADQDLGEIFEYIASYLKAPLAALNLVEVLHASLKELSVMPYRHSLSKDPFLAKQGFHAFIVENYLIFYVVDDCTETVIVHRIVYAKRNYRDLFTL